MSFLWLPSHLITCRSCGMYFIISEESHLRLSFPDTKLWEIDNHAEVMDGVSSHRDERENVPLKVTQLLRKNKIVCYASSWLTDKVQFDLDVRMLMFWVNYPFNSRTQWCKRDIRFLINRAALLCRQWQRTNTRCIHVCLRQPSECAALKTPNSLWRSPSHP